MLDSWDFSFSGLKTAVLYYVNSLKSSKIQPSTLDRQLISDICASFQEAVVETLTTKIIHATKKLNCNRVCISGGVSANEYLREKFLNLAKKNNLEVYFPQKNLSTDNAAMIAALGKYFYN